MAEKTDSEIISKAVIAKLKSVGLPVTSYEYSSADPETAVPYCLISYANGGRLNTTPVDDVDATYIIGCLSDNLAEAHQVSGAIMDALDDAIDLTFDEDWTVYAPVRVGFPLEDDMLIQNKKYHFVGSHYRFRLQR